MTVTPEALGTVMPLDNRGEYTLVTAIETTDGVPVVGNVIRRTCELVGSGACAQTCQLAALRGEAGVAPGEAAQALVDAGTNPADALEANPKACSDKNLLDALTALDIHPSQALMVGVGTEAADRVGFLDDAAVRSEISRNPHGWGEVSGYNAFFMRKGAALPPKEGEEPRPVRWLADRLADSGQVMVEMTATDGTEIVGLIHSTRTNMMGLGHEKEYGRERQPFIQHAIGEAMARYGVWPDDVTLRVVAAVGPEAWRKRYDNTAKMERSLPGWAAEGLIENKTNPDWQPGQEVANPVTGKPDEVWPNYPEMVRRQAVRSAAAWGITDVRAEDPLDPGQPRGTMVHSSANRIRIARNEGGVAPKDTRDAYAIVLSEESVAPKS